MDQDWLVLGKSDFVAQDVARTSLYKDDISCQAPQPPRVIIILMVIVMALEG